MVESRSIGEDYCVTGELVMLIESSSESHLMEGTRRLCRWGVGRSLAWSGLTRIRSHTRGAAGERDSFPRSAQRRAIKSHSENNIFDIGKIQAKKQKDSLTDTARET